MKHLLNGVAIAAVLVIAAPAWAQAPMTPSSAPKAAAAPAAPMAGAPMASKQRHHRSMHHMAGHVKMGPGEAMTEQLNREELARIQGGGMPAPPGPANAGAGQGGPRPSGH